MIRDQYLDGHRDPDLSFHGVLTGNEKALIRRCLIHLTKCSHLPAGFADLDNSKSGQGEVVYKKSEPLRSESASA